MKKEREECIKATKLKITLISKEIFVLVLALAAEALSWYGNGVGNMGLNSIEWSVSLGCPVAPTPFLILWYLDK